MENKLTFDEIELNYILEAVQHFRERIPTRPTGPAVYEAALKDIEEKIARMLDGGQ